jgi:hypothetical protein
MEENPTGCLDRDLDLMAAPAANTCAVRLVAFFSAGDDSAQGVSGAHS